MFRAGTGLRHSSNLRGTTKNDGTNNTARHVEASIPVITLRPGDARAFAPAPVAMTSGTTPRMKAKEVMMMGRKRAAVTAASKDWGPVDRAARATFAPKR